MADQQADRSSLSVDDQCCKCNVSVGEAPAEIAFHDHTIVHRGESAVFLVCSSCLGKSSEPEGCGAGLDEESDEEVEEDG